MATSAVCSPGVVLKYCDWRRKCLAQTCSCIKLGMECTDACVLIVKIVVRTKLKCLMMTLMEIAITGTMDKNSSLQALNCIKLFQANVTFLYLLR